MENIWTLVIFVRSQPQATMMQYRTLEAAASSRNAFRVKTHGIVCISDDYGRSFDVLASDVQAVLMQDMREANAGNTAANTMAMAAQKIAEYRAQQEAMKDPDIRSEVSAQRFGQGAQQFQGAFRQ